ncbi:MULTISPECIES: LysR family transcriptional regulator [Amycolatopsis]|uniref:LysR family transcriptional regulator n=1 Tax=Amycolatopsis dongchuanensis TaxID=1070866 RepID=A0ABP8VCC0_9PSEU
MELRALRYFVTVAEELHFGRAAERLHIVQPAVSQQVARLERELGVRLLNRSSRTVRLTDAGERVLEAAREALLAVERVRGAAVASKTLRIGTAPGLGARLERGVEALRAYRPELDVVLVDLPVAERVQALRRGELDLALSRGMLCGHGIRVIPAWSEPLRVVVSARHPLAGREAVSLADFAEFALRLPPRQADPALHEAVVEALRDGGFSPRVGRPAGTVQDMLVEVGLDPGSWALLPDDQLAGVVSDRIRVLSPEPPLAVTGSILARDDDLTESCGETVAAAFR